jgi:hypothetical protein
MYEGLIAGNRIYGSLRESLSNATRLPFCKLPHPEGRP